MTTDSPSHQTIRSELSTSYFGFLISGAVLFFPFYAVPDILNSLSQFKLPLSGLTAVLFSVLIPFYFFFYWLFYKCNLTFIFYDQTLEIHRFGNKILKIEPNHLKEITIKGTSNNGLATWVRLNFINGASYKFPYFLSKSNERLFIERLKQICPTPFIPGEWNTAYYTPLFFSSYFSVQENRRSGYLLLLQILALMVSIPFGVYFARFCVSQLLFLEANSAIILFTIPILICAYFIYRNELRSNEDAFQRALKSGKIPLKEANIHNADPHSSFDKELKTLKSSEKKVLMCTHVATILVITASVVLKIYSDHNPALDRQKLIKIASITSILLSTLASIYLIAWAKSRDTKRILSKSELKLSSNEFNGRTFN